MADVTIEASYNAGVSPYFSRFVVYTTRLIGYVFYWDDDSDLKYNKTTDGGATWAGPTLIETAGTPVIFDVWYDKWTPGDNGTRIHIWYCESVADNVMYNYLDTNGDGLGTEVIVFDGASAVAASDNLAMSGSKARNGNLYVLFDIDGGVETGFYRSDDAGATWDVLADANEDTGSLRASDYYLLFPGNESDQADMWLVFWDHSANEISLKVYDDSGDSWAETSIATSMTEALRTNFNGQFSGAIRHSDRHLILAAWSALDAVGADLKVWDITSAASIAAKTDVVTDSDDCVGAALFINQNNNTLYCAYAGKSDGSETFGTTITVFYKSSTDGGTTWGSESAMGETAYNIRALGADLGGTNSRFIPTWLDETNDDVLTNFVNSVAVFSSGGGGGGGQGGGRGGGNSGGGGPGGGGGNGGGGGPGPKKDSIVASRRRHRLTAGVL